MDNLKINVIDGIMGSGKSTAIMNYVKAILKTNPNQKILIVLLYHKEIERYYNVLKNHSSFKPITEKISYKKGALQQAFTSNMNIICTQALFLEHHELFQENGKDYILIIDEVINSTIEQVQLPTFNIIEKVDNETHTPKTITYNFTSNDIDFMIEQK